MKVKEIAGGTHWFRGRVGLPATKRISRSLHITEEQAAGATAMLEQFLRRRSRVTVSPVKFAAWLIMALKEKDKNFQIQIVGTGISVIIGSDTYVFPFQGGFKGRMASVEGLEFVIAHLNGGTREGYLF